MSIPEQPKPYYLKDPLDNAIDEFAKLDKPTSADLDRVGTIGQVQAGLDKYCAAAKHMTVDELEGERHNSKRLGQHLLAAGSPRPNQCHAHAIVSGVHREAAEMRAVLAWAKLRIDDPDNGCWLPANTAATPHPRFPSAVPHSRIHRNGYYNWINRIINFQNIQDQPYLRQSLKMIARQLQHGNFPPYVMDKAKA